ncbi:MAG: hypothetical protein U0670_21980 [Anaerolineae bacterium]
MFDFVSVGMRIVAATDLPPQLLQMPFGTLLMTLIRAGTMLHTGMAIKAAMLKRSAIPMSSYRLNTPMPDDLSYGIFYGYVNRLIPKNWTFTVKYEEESRV